MIVVDIEPNIIGRKVFYKKWVSICSGVVSKVWFVGGIKNNPRNTFYVKLEDGTVLDNWHFFFSEEGCRSKDIKTERFDIIGYPIGQKFFSLAHGCIYEYKYIGPMICSGYSKYMLVLKDDTASSIEPVFDKWSVSSLLAINTFKCFETRDLCEERRLKDILRRSYDDMKELEKELALVKKEFNSNRERLERYIKSMGDNKK